MMCQGFLYTKLRETYHGGMTQDPLMAEGIQGASQERPPVLAGLEPGDFAFVAGVMKKPTPLEGAIAERNDDWKAARMREVLLSFTTAKQVVALGGFVQSGMDLSKSEEGERIELSPAAVSQALSVALSGVKRWEDSQKAETPADAVTPSAT